MSQGLRAVLPLEIRRPGPGLRAIMLTPELAKYPDSVQSPSAAAHVRTRLARNISRPPVRLAADDSHANGPQEIEGLDVVCV